MKYRILMILVMVLARTLPPPVTRLQRSVEQEQMVAVTSPPSCLVLQPWRLAGPPHSLVRMETCWNFPLVTRQDWEVAGQVTSQAGSGLNLSQSAWLEL